MMIFKFIFIHIMSLIDRLSLVFFNCIQRICIDPTGRILAEAGPGEEIVFHEIGWFTFKTKSNFLLKILFFFNFLL